MYFVDPQMLLPLTYEFCPLWMLVSSLELSHTHIHSHTPPHRFDSVLSSYRSSWDSLTLAASPNLARIPKRTQQHLSCMYFLTFISLFPANIYQKG